MAKEKTQEEKQEELKEKQQDQVMRVIKGHNDVFEEEYTFKEFDLEFKIKLRFPTMMEQARVTGATEREFQGLGQIINANFRKAVWMAKVIQQQQEVYEGNEEAIYIPDILKEPEEIYNPLILATVADDFQNWMNSFRY